jgi:tetratricopeptide (TPR) repeat protein
LFIQDDKDAEKYCRQALGYKNDHPETAFYNLGLVLGAQDQFKEALDCFKEALEIKPDYNEANIAWEDMQKVFDYLGK